MNGTFSGIKFNNGYGRFYLKAGEEKNILLPNNNYSYSLSATNYNDYNLNKVAQFQGVEVLNINELANAIKPVAIPGEEMVVQVVKEGKEHSQGIAYLDDGTMIVVDGGKKHMGETIRVLVTSVLQTPAGRMIFGKPKN